MRFWEFISSTLTYQDKPIVPQFKLHETQEKEYKKYYDVYKKNPSVKVSTSLEYNVDYIKQRYYYDKNSDLIIRDINIKLANEKVPASIMFFDGMVDRTLVGQLILKPILGEIKEQVKENRIVEYLAKNVISQNQVKLQNEFDKIISELNFGSCIIFVEGNSQAIIMDVKGWEHRNISTPQSETIIKGPQEGFAEILRINTSLVRKILKNEAFVNEALEVGKMGKTPVSLMYINNVVNKDLVDEVRRRIENIETSYIMDTGELEQLIIGNQMVLTPLTLSTERPDRVAMSLNEGKVAVMMDGSPYALIMPVTANAFLNLTEDRYMRYTMTNFLRVIRILSILISLMLPALFIAIVGFHPEILQTELFFTIENAKEQTPFPLLFELFTMEFAFELIKEAGLRIPGPIGPTIGIVGALIMGQAAVEANIASSILIIIVAITGLGSFATPSYDFAFSLRISRFFYTISAALFGFFGIAIVIFLHVSILCSTNSLGVPFFAPLTPRTGKTSYDTLFVKPLWKQEFRDDSLQTQVRVKQPKYSKVWLFNKK